MAEKNILYMTIPDLKSARAVIEKKIANLQEKQEPNQTVIQKLQNMANKYTKAERQINKYFEKNKKKPGFTNGGRNTIKLIEALRWYNKPILGADINPIKKGYNALDGISDLQGVLTGVGVSVMGIASVNQIIKKVTKGEKNLASIVGEFVKNNPGFAAAMASGAALILIAKGVPAIRRKAKQMQSNIAQTRKAQNEITDEIYGDTFDRSALLKKPDEFNKEDKDKGIVSSAKELGEQLANSPEMLSKFMEIVKNRSAHPEYSNTEVANIVSALNEANTLLEKRKKAREDFLDAGPMGIDREVYDRKLEEYNIEYAKYEKKDAKYEARKDNIIFRPKKPTAPTAPTAAAEALIKDALTKANAALEETKKIQTQLNTELTNAESELTNAESELTSAESELTSANTSSDADKIAQAKTNVAVAQNHKRNAQAKVDKLKSAKEQADDAVSKIEKYIKDLKAETLMESAVAKAEETTTGVEAEKTNATQAQEDAKKTTTMSPEQKKALLKFIDTYLGASNETDVDKKGTFSKKQSEQGGFSAQNILTTYKTSTATENISIDLGNGNTIEKLTKDQADDIAGLLEVLDALSVKDETVLNDYSEKRKKILDNIMKLKESLGLKGLSDDEKKALKNIKPNELGLS